MLTCREGTARKGNDDGVPGDLAPSDLQEERSDLEHAPSARVNAGL